MAKRGRGKIYDRFSKPVLEVVVFAKAASIDANVDCIYPESFIIGMLTTGDNEVSSALMSMGVDLDVCLKTFKTKLVKRVKQNESSTPNFDTLGIAKQVNDASKVADKIATEVGSEYIILGHLFLGFIEVSRDIRSVFEKQNIEIEDLIKTFKKKSKVQAEGSPSPRKKGKIKALESFCVNMTEQARNNELDPIIAREKEIESAITILCRRSKNNPMLLGEPGVGKTAIVEGLSQRVVSNTVPKQLRGFEVYSLSLSSLVAGTKYRGEFEERIEALVQEIKKVKNCILFIDEIHTIVGAGSAAGGALDASNILKPFLARSELRCIGATTLEDFKKYFQKDGALSRRFQKITVEEPTKEQALQIVGGVKERLEQYHNCELSQESLESSVELSGRYLTNRNFPDKALDCIDMACAKKAWDKNDKKKPVIGREDVALVISEQCGIPLEVILWDDYEKVARIEEKMKARVIGQDYAVETVCGVLKNAYSGIRNPNKPIGVFVFGGQTGTGKTYMSQELAEAVCGDKAAIIRLDMSEFAEEHTVSKLIGSPPGYVGFQETDSFLDKVSRKLYSIILLDEMEKAHPNVMRLFLQVMSDGHMSNAIGTKVNFKNVMLIMTGNFGMNEDAKKLLGFADEEKKSVVDQEQSRLVKYCKEKYGEEFVNRVDEFIPFAPLNDESLVDIAKIQVGELSERVSHRNCKLRFDKSIYDELVRLSHEEYGKNATILRRLITKKLEPCISDALLSLPNTGFYFITISCSNGEFKHWRRKSQRKS